jgi:S1-C subfamily serine protease
MNAKILKRKTSILFAMGLSLFACSALFAIEIEDSVIKIYCASQSYVFNQPWKKTNVRTGRGTGFITESNKILTNAHVVSNAKYIEVQKYRGSKKYIAQVEFISHGSDLALLRVMDKKFYEGLVPLKFGKLPELNSTVTTYGYPVGGVQLSVTRGVVSRMEMHTYSHSGTEQHLTIQTDAAINPGNSGGPVIQDGKVVGIAFQGLTTADNVGYLIPNIVVKQFLDDIKNGEVNGFSDLAIDYREYCENPSVRKIIALPEEVSGVVVTRLFPNMPAWKKLKKMDVIIAINGLPISNDGFIYLDGRKVNFQEAVERLQVGSTIPLDIWRDKKKIKVDVLAKAWKMPINIANPYGVIPKYYIFGGLAFTPLSKGYISAAGGWKRLTLAVKKLYTNASMEEKYATYKEFPVLTQRLPETINVNMEKFKGRVVDSVNGHAIYSMLDLKSRLENSEKELIEIKFMRYDVPLIISKKDALEQGPLILSKYHIAEKERL